MFPRVTLESTNKKRRSLNVSSTFSDLSRPYIRRFFFLRFSFSFLFYLSHSYTKTIHSSPSSSDFTSTVTFNFIKFQSFLYFPFDGVNRFGERSAGLRPVALSMVSPQLHPATESTLCDRSDLIGREKGLERERVDRRQRFREGNAGKRCEEIVIDSLMGLSERFGETFITRFHPFQAFPLCVSVDYSPRGTSLERDASISIEHFIFSHDETVPNCTRKFLSEFLVFETSQVPNLIEFNL